MHIVIASMLFRHRRLCCATGVSVRPTGLATWRQMKIALLLRIAAAVKAENVASLQRCKLIFGNIL
jgi:hypothetical protein